MGDNKNQLEKALEEAKALIAKIDDLKDSLVKMCGELEESLGSKDVEVEETEDLVVEEEAPVEEVAAPVEEPVARPTIDPNLGNDEAINLDATPAEQPAPVEEKPAGLTNFKAALNEYPTEIEVVNPAQVKVEEKPKKTMFQTPSFQPLDGIQIDIVNPNAAPAQAAPVAQNAVQFEQAPVAPVVPEITQTQNFTDPGMQPPQTVM